VRLLYECSDDWEQVQLKQQSNEECVQIVLLTHYFSHGYFVTLVSSAHQMAIYIMVVSKRKSLHKSMKIKTLSLIAGVFALTLTAAPFVAQANTTLDAPLQLAQTPAHHGRGEFFAQLGLSDSQTEQIKQIHSSTREQIQQIITPEQKQAFKTAMQNHQGFKAARQAMNLTDEQKSQLKQVWQSSHDQIQAILTPSQQTQLEQLRQQWRANHPKSDS